MGVFGQYLSYILLTLIFFFLSLISKQINYTYHAVKGCKLTKALMGAMAHFAANTKQQNYT